MRPNYVHKLSQEEIIDILYQSRRQSVLYKYQYS